MMIPSNLFLFAICIASCSMQGTDVADKDQIEMFPIRLIGHRASQIIRNRFLKRLRNRSKEICYDKVGCFPAPRMQAVAPLKKPPQPPEMVDTKFILVTRNTSGSGDENERHFLKYGDGGGSLVEADFSPELPCAVIVHGYKGSGADRGVSNMSATLLKLENANVILADWHKGAAGPSYVAAASNTQLVGRQLALLIADMVALGTNPGDIHVIGFSLGAHIAGFAGRELKRDGISLGRITGLDPASPLFRELFSTSLSPLHRTDADFVDIIHTDGGRFLSEGLGIFKPIGNADFFPNGGHDQPGCKHTRGGTVLANHLGNSLNTDLVCNHIRAWQLFSESLEPRGCQFLAFPCPGGWSNFLRGNCFPTKCTDQNCGKMGYYSNKGKFVGPLYLVTRESSPFCGYQLKTSVILSQTMPEVRGYMQMTISTANEHINQRLYSEFRDELTGGHTLHGVTAAKYETFDENLPNSLDVHLSSFVYSQKRKRSAGKASVDEIIIRDLRGNKWRYYGKNTVLHSINGTDIDAVSVELRRV